MTAQDQRGRETALAKLRAVIADAGADGVVTVAAVIAALPELAPRPTSPDRAR